MLLAREADDLAATAPMMLHDDDEDDLKDTMEVPLLDDDEDNSETSVIMFDDDEDADQGSATVVKKGRKAVDESMFDHEDGEESEEFAEDELEVSDEVLGKSVLHRIESSISYITLNRPESGNAILPEQREVIAGLLLAAERDPDVRCVVLGATGRLFCAGADMKTLSRTTNANDEVTKGTEPQPRPGDRARFLMNGPQAAQRYS